MIVAIAVFALVVGITIGWFSFWFLDPAGRWCDLHDTLSAAALAAAQKERDAARDALRDAMLRLQRERDTARESMRYMERHATALATHLARLESHLAPMADRPSFCPECGPGVAVDADGCCSCGCDALGAAADDLAALVKRGVER